MEMRGNVDGEKEREMWEVAAKLGTMILWVFLFDGYFFNFFNQIANDGH